MLAGSKLPILLSTAIFSASAHAGTGCLDTMFQDSFEDLSMNAYEVELVVNDLGSRSASFQLNGGETITAAGDGIYCFSEQIQGGQPYEVAITEQPATDSVCGGDLTGTATSRVRIAITCNLDRTEWDQFNWDQADWN